MKKISLLTIAVLLSACMCQPLNRGSAHAAKIRAANDGQAIERSELLDAIVQAGEAKEKTAAAPITELMFSTNDLAVGNACISALSEINEPEAMPSIINFVERKPALIRRQAIIAARKIANQNAAEWLFVMAYGYEDALVRKEALAALEEVERRLGYGSN